MAFKGFLAAFVGASAVRASTGPLCQDLLIPVNINALNRVLPAVTTAADITVQVLESVLGMPKTSVSGDYVIAATFCEPSTKVASRHNTLQVLVHGAAYTRTYWDSLGTGQSLYSWVAYASSQGYPTLAIDRLCSGLSSHPNSLSVCQLPAETEAVHALIQQARAGTLPLGTASSRAFTRVVAVGNSIGSDLVSILAQSHPGDADAALLTGWSNGVVNGIPTVAFGSPTPAYQVYPDRFGNLSSDPGYLTFANKTGQQYLSYYGDYAQATQDHDYATQGTFTVGEALTQILGQAPAPAFTGPVLVLDGDEDATYCQPSLLTAAARATGNCLLGNAANSRVNFPAARVFNSSITPNTGHCINLHLTAPSSYQVAFNFLKQNGF